jgi:hypothetical protein
MTNKFPTVVALPTFNRLNLLRPSVESLLRCSPDRFYLFDDGSEPETLRYLESVTAENSNVTLVVNDHNIGGDANIMKLCGFLSTKYPAFILSGSDFLHSSRFVSTLYGLYEKHKPVMVGSFKPHKLHKGVKDLGDCEQVSGMIGPVLKDSSYFQSIKDRMDWRKHNHDWAFAKIAWDEDKQLMIRTPVSIAQHLGLWEGQHTKRCAVGFGFCGEYCELDFPYYERKKRRPAPCQLWLQRGTLVIKFYPNGDVDYGNYQGIWRVEGSHLTIHSSVFSVYAEISSDSNSYAGFEYPGGTRIYGGEVNAVRLPLEALESNGRLRDSFRPTR